MTITASIRHAEAGPELVLQGEGKLPDAAVLAGRRARVDGSPAADGTRGWTAALPLRSARGGERELPLPTGDYRLRLDGADAGEVAAASIADTMTSTMRVALRDGTLTVRPPIDAAYDSAEAQAALERRYATRPGGELENAVFFESFYGRIAGCNPRAIDRELARAAPGVIRYWSVVDLSVAVPDGAVAVVEGSPQWWRARASARLLVVNDWLRRRYVRRPGQRVLQTWHGTPLKRLALHRPGFDLRRMLAVVREGRRWDVLLAQNEYGARTLRAAYAFLRRPIWVEGYPRNDELSAGTGSRQQEIRSLLGIGAEEHVLLYAPTWRDDREQIVDFLDLPAFAEATGSVVLVRAKSPSSRRQVRSPAVLVCNGVILAVIGAALRLGVLDQFTLWPSAALFSACATASWKAGLSAFEICVMRALFNMTAGAARTGPDATPAASAKAMRRMVFIADSLVVVRAARAAH